MNWQRITDDPASLPPRGEPVAALTEDGEWVKAHFSTHAGGSFWYSAEWECGRERGYVSHWSRVEPPSAEQASEEEQPPLDGPDPEEMAALVGGAAERLDLAEENGRLRGVLKEVEDWWLRDGMKLPGMYGAPSAIFSVRAALANEAASPPAAPPATPATPVSGLAGELRRRINERMRSRPGTEQFDAAIDVIADALDAGEAARRELKQVLYRLEACLPGVPKTLPPVEWAEATIRRAAERIVSVEAALQKMVDVLGRTELPSGVIEFSGIREAYAEARVFLEGSRA